MKKLKSLTKSETIESISKAIAIPADVLDRLALFAVNDLASKGLSNKSISQLIGIDIEGVREDLKEYEFDGFEVDLKINPMSIYDKCQGNFQDFCESLSDSFGTKRAIEIFKFLNKFDVLRKELNKYYGIT